MPDFVLLMHDDATDQRAADDPALWNAYVMHLIEADALEGGSAFGGGITLRKGDRTPAPVSRIAGFMRIEAADLAAARALIPGNPVYEAGGTVEIRELPVTD
ncbi:MAG: hypothetical protein JNM13_14300 [Hyphomicrobiaceae bacterium]|nr:hypothetical protein [Hyphomicrobiaceae bacterium]